MTLTILIHDSIEKKLEFLARLFDIDNDSKIGIDDMESFLHARITLKTGKSIGEPSKDKFISAKLKELFSNKKIIAYDFCEFKEVIPEYINIDEVLEIFQIIPSPSQEYSIINKAMGSNKLKNYDTYYVINNEWYRAWNLLVCSYKNERHPKAFFDEELFEDSIVNVYPSPLTAQSKTKNITKMVSCYNEKFDSSLFIDSVTRPGEINNSALAGPRNGSRKDGLMVNYSS